MQLCSPPLLPHQTLLPPQQLHPGLYFSKALLRGLSKEGNLCFKIDWASFIFGSNFIVFALFYFVFVANFQVLAHGGLIFGRAI